MGTNAPTVELLYAAIAGIVRDNNELTLRQLAILMHIFRTDYIFSSSELARDLNLAKPNITRACDRLVAEGLIERVQDTHDKRLVRLVGTRDGERYMKRLARLVTA